MQSSGVSSRLHVLHRHNGPCRDSTYVNSVNYVETDGHAVAAVDEETGSTGQVGYGAEGYWRDYAVNPFTSPETEAPTAGAQPLDSGDEGFCPRCRSAAPTIGIRGEGGEWGAGGTRAASPRNAGPAFRLRYEPSPKHGPRDIGRSSRAPANGQDALDQSIQVKSTSPRRVGIDYETGDFVVFDQTSQGIFHGHVRSWSGPNGLTQAMQRALRESGMVDRRGRILWSGA